MAKENTDKVTIDLFVDQPRKGRPRTNPLPRSEQLKINKRRQLQRDRRQGRKRIELKVDQSVHEHLNKVASSSGCNRSDLVEAMIKISLANPEQVLPAVVNLVKSGES